MTSILAFLALVAIILFLRRFSRHLETRRAVIEAMAELEDQVDNDIGALTPGQRKP